MLFRGEETLPAPLATLVRQLEEGGAQAPPEFLSPVSAAQELKAVTAAVLAGRGAPFKADKTSLQVDLQESFACLGPSSRALHATIINDFRKQVSRLETLLDDGAGARVFQGDADVLLAELTSDTSLVAAFDDAVAAFDSEAFAGVCEQRLRYLKTVVEAAGHDWSDRSRRLHDALAGSYAALHVAGALDPPHAGETLHFDDSGLTTEERLCLARTVLTGKATHGTVVVWLVYANAFLSGMHLQRGPVEFYDSRIWQAVVEGHWHGNPGWTQPPELSEPTASDFMRGLPEENFVMVRVSRRAYCYRARSRAQSRPSSARAQRLAVGLGPHGRRVRSLQCLVRQRGLQRSARAPAAPTRLADADPAAHVLADVEADLLERIAAREPAAVELLADTRWRRTISGSPTPSTASRSSWPCSSARWCRRPSAQTSGTALVSATSSCCWLSTTSSCSFVMPAS